MTIQIQDPVSSTIQAPTLRPRRLRLSTGLRRMVRETILTPADFIYPLFVRSGNGIRNPVNFSFQWTNWPAKPRKWPNWAFPR